MKIMISLINLKKMNHELSLIILKLSEIEMYQKYLVNLLL